MHAANAMHYSAQMSQMHISSKKHTVICLKLDESMILLHITRWQKHKIRTKILEIVANGHVMCDSPIMQMTSLHDVNAKITHWQTWWPWGATRKRSALLHSFSAAAVWEWSDVRREEEERRRSLSSQHPCSFRQASSFLRCSTVHASSSVLLALHYRSVELVWKAAAVLGFNIHGFLEWSHSRQQSLALYPSPCPITSLPSPLTRSCSLSVHSCDAYAIKSYPVKSTHLYCYRLSQSSFTVIRKIMTLWQKHSG